MNTIQFKNVHTVVRPHRIAVLLSEQNPEWEQTCREVVGILATVWGGRASIIIPTDGSAIRPTFWQLLEAYDPDYICTVEWTLWQEIERRPDQYEKWFEKWLERESGTEAADVAEPDRKEKFERFARDFYSFRSATISPTLESELKTRLAPFFFDHSVLKTLNRTKPDSSFPFTNICTILPKCEHPKTISLPEVDAEGLSALWVESITGRCPKEVLDFLGARGIVANPIKIDDTNVSTELAELLGNQGEPIGKFGSGPFSLSMVQLAAYRRAGVIDDASITVVSGSTVLDFALYFSLKAMRTRVYWLPAEWIDRLEKARSRAANGGRPVDRNEEYSRFLAQRLVNETFRRRPKSVFYLSLSLDENVLSQTAGKLAECAYTFGDRLAGAVKICTDVGELLSQPLRVLNIDSLSTVTSQLVGNQLAGFFPTPKPKGFRDIAPYDHRWISELRVDGQLYPRHPQLGEFVVRDRTLTTDEVRCGREGVCYFCPSNAYFGGDVDTVLRRPEIFLPTASELFGYLARSAGLNSKLSDKGFYSQEFVRKLGGLGDAALFLRDPTISSILNEFLKQNDVNAKGCFLSSDRRRYLDLEGIKSLSGSENVGDLVDTFVGKELLHRGLVLKCRFCRTADWFSLSDVGEAFRCNRCRTQQSILSGSLFSRPEPLWYYKLDELIYQGLSNNMQVPLLALDSLRRKSQFFMYADEQEFTRNAENRPFVEADICCVKDGVLTIGEAKTANQLADGSSAERALLNKYRELAFLLGARGFVLASEHDWSARTIANVSETFRETNISVSILQRSDLYAN